MYIRLGDDFDFLLKCLKVFYKKRERVKFKKLCFLLNERPSNLLNKKIFRDLIIENVFVPERDTSNPDQEYLVDWFRLKSIFWKSNVIKEIENALKTEILEEQF